MEVGAALNFDRNFLNKVVEGGGGRPPALSPFGLTLRARPSSKRLRELASVRFAGQKEHYPKHTKTFAQLLRRVRGTVKIFDKLGESI